MNWRRAASLAVLLSGLVPAHSWASASALYGTSCITAGANNVSAADSTGNNFICDSGTLTWKYPIYQFGSTAASCAAGLAGGLQWTGSALQLCNGTTWGTLGFANNGINLGTSATAANPQISGDATSGLFTPTGSTVAITTNGAERLRVASGGSVAIGTTTANAKLQVNGTVIVANGGETCDATHAGGIRYNSGTSVMEFCNGLAWTPFKATGGPSASGYFVESAGGWNACFGRVVNSISNSGTTATLTTGFNHYLSTGASVTITGATPSAYNGTFTITVTTPAKFTYTMGSNPGSSDTTASATSYCSGSGGLVQANSLCLSDLTTNTSWFGYVQANAAGLVNSSHVTAFLCDGVTCNNLDANTTYYFASAYDSTAGGHSFTTDGSGLGPNDTTTWSEGDAFAAASGDNYWTGRAAGSATKWGSTSAATTCSGWTTNSSGSTGEEGIPDQNNSNRWAYTPGLCNVTFTALICLVNP